jgi:hypothetical protein
LVVSDLRLATLEEPLVKLTQRRRHVDRSLQGVPALTPGRRRHRREDVPRGLGRVLDALAVSVKEAVQECGYDRPEIPTRLRVGLVLVAPEHVEHLAVSLVKRIGTTRLTGCETCPIV